MLVQCMVVLDVVLVEMVKVGFIGVGDLGIDIVIYWFYCCYVDQYKLIVCIYVMIYNIGVDFDIISQGGLLVGYGNDFFSVCVVKFYVDGVLGSCGVVLFLFYFDDMYNCGLLFQL